MRRITGFASALWRNRRGATAVEYGLILALVVLTVIGAITQLAGQTVGMWNNVNDKVTKASN